jgi:hypothetical protein
VKANMLQLLGFLCESFPGAMYQRSSQLLQIFLDSLNKQFKSEKPDMKIISGGIQGLCSLLVHFEHNFLEGPARLCTFDYYYSFCIYLFLWNNYDQCPRTPSSFTSTSAWPWSHRRT